MKRFFRNPILPAILFALLLSIIITLPASFQLNSSFIGDGGDNYEYAAYQSLFAQNIQHGLLPFSGSDMLRFPIGFPFNRAFDSYITVTTGGILTFAVGMPAAYNLTIFLLLAANGILSFLFFRKLSKSTRLGLLGMLIYGFSFYTIARAASHPNLLFIGSFAFFGYALLRIIQHTRLKTKDYVLVCLSVVVIALGSQEYLLFFAMFFPFFILCSFLFYKEKTLDTIKKILNPKGLLTLVVTCALLLLIYLPQIKAALTHSNAFLDRSGQLAVLTPSFSYFFLPNTYLPLLITKLAQSNGNFSIEQAVFLGFVELVLFGLFLFWPLKKRVKAFLLLLSTVPFLFALGYGLQNSFPLLPYRFLSGIFPFSSIPETGRFVVIVYFFITIAIITLLETNKRYVRVVVPILILLLLVERVPSSFYTSSTLGYPYTKIVAKQSGRGVLDIPINLSYPTYSELAFLYKKPIVNGYFHWSADTNQEKSFIFKNQLLSRYMCNLNDPILTHFDFQKEAQEDKEMIALLKKYGIITIVVHKDYYFTYPECKNVRLRLTRLAPFIRQLTPKDAGHLETIVGIERDGKPSFTYYLPKSGMLYIDGAYLKSQQPLHMYITIDNNDAPFQYNWPTNKDGSQILQPDKPIALQLSAKSAVTFFSGESRSSTLLTIWYRYQPTAAPIYPLVPTVQYLFEDDKSIVYGIH